MPYRSLLADPSGKNEWQTFGMLLCLYVGISEAFGGPNPGTLAAAMPEWGIRCWAVGLVVGALTTLFAVYYRWKQPDSGILIEGVGNANLALAGLIYTGMSLFVVHAARDLFSVLLVVSLTILATKRAWGRFKIIAEVRRTRKVIGDAS